MKINMVCVGTRMPQWVEVAVAEYRKRLPRDFEFIVTEVPLGQRGKSTESEAAILKVMEKEGEACLRAVSASDFVIALDVKGRSLSTEEMASQIGKLRDEGFNLVLLVGGPDGLSPACLKAARATWSLSALTFPHPIVRVILAEQLYRAWSLLSGHPYHRS
jgi:23S rRNA (pseudouridine1915-N3)-methyltransferase